MRRCRDAIASRSRVPAACPRKFFRGLPEQTFSSELNAKLLDEIRTQTAPYDTAISEMEEMPNDWIYLEQHVTPFGSRPVRVLTTWHFGRPPSAPADVRRERLAFERATRAKSSITMNTGITFSSITRKSSLRQFAMCSIRSHFGLAVCQNMIRVEARRLRRPRGRARALNTI